MELMKKIKSNPKATFKNFILSVFYYTACFFLFIFLVNNVLIELITHGRPNITRKEFDYLLVGSLIVGVACSCRAWLFTKIDERNEKNKHE